jgi:repressor LexA
MLQLYKNIKNRRIALGLSQDELAQKTGYTSRSSIAKIESGKVDLPQTKIKLFAEALETTQADLMGWDIDNSEASRSLSNIENIIPLPNTKKIPLLGKIACGDPITAVENIEDYVEVPEFTYADFALTCQGDSMINARIMDGDIVYIRQQPEVENGEIAAVLIDGEATLKRVFYGKGSIMLQAENPAYQPMMFSKEEILDVRILGKATYFLSKVK